MSEGYKIMEKVFKLIIHIEFTNEKSNIPGENAKVKFVNTLPNTGNENIICKSYICDAVTKKPLGAVLEFAGTNNLSMRLRCGEKSTKFTLKGDSTMIHQLELVDYASAPADGGYRVNI